MTGSQIP